MKFKSLFSLLFIVTLLLTSCAPATPESPTPAQSAATAVPTATVPAPTAEPDVVRLGAQPLISHAPFYIAEAEGFFAEQNIIVEFVPIETGSEVLPLLASGDLDVVAGALNVAQLNLMAQDSNIRIVADKGYTDPDSCPSSALLLRKDLIEAGVLDSPDTVRGLSLISNQVGINGYTIARWLDDKYGLTLEDVTLENLPRPAQIDAINNSAMDGIHAVEPFLTTILDATQTERVDDLTQYTPGLNVANMLYGERLRVTRQDIGERFMIAYLKAVRQYAEGSTERNLEIIAGYTGLELDLLRRVCFPTIRTDGQINYQAALEYLQWEYDAGRLEVLNTEDQYWDSHFVEYALSQLD